VGALDGYLELLAPLPERMKVTDRLSANADLVRIFASSRAKLAKALRSYRAKLKPTAVVWGLWLKKTSKVPIDITEDTVREVALPLAS
jgi:hypothetical protein